MDEVKEAQNQEHDASSATVMMDQETEIEMLREKLAACEDEVERLLQGRVHERSGSNDMRRKRKPVEDVDKIDPTWKYRAVED